MRGVQSSWVYLPVLLLVVLCPLVEADPTGSVEGGGTVRLLAEHPTVSLNTERLIFQPLTNFTRVTAILEMENHGPAATVPMGFPVPLWHPGRGQDFVKNFSVTVDGAAMEVTEDKHVQLALGSGTIYCRWYRFTVPFAAEQKIQMTVVYDVYGTGMSQVSYVLATGGTWKDTIRSFELEVRLGERLNFNSINLTGDKQPLPYEKQGDSLIWRAADYNGKPEVLWFSATPGPAAVTLDGVKAWPVFRHGKQAGEVSLMELYHLPVRCHEGKLLVSSTVLSDLLMVRVRNPETVEGDWRTLLVERQGVTCQARGIKLPRPTVDDKERSYCQVVLPSQTNET